MLQNTKKMEPAHEIVNIYFDMRPFEVTKETYRRKGLKCCDYWYNELKYILVDSLEFNEGSTVKRSEYAIWTLKIERTF